MEKPSKGEVAKSVLILIAASPVIVGILLADFIKKQLKKSDVANQPQPADNPSTSNTPAAQAVGGNTVNLSMSGAADGYSATVEITISKTGDSQEPEAQPAGQTVEVAVECNGKYYACEVPINPEGKLVPDFSIGGRKRDYKVPGTAAEGIKKAIGKRPKLTERNDFREISRKEYKKIQRENERIYGR